MKKDKEHCPHCYAEEEKKIFQRDEKAEDSCCCNSYKEESGSCCSSEHKEDSLSCCSSKQAVYSCCSGVSDHGHEGGCCGSGHNHNSGKNEKIKNIIIIAVSFVTLITSLILSLTHVYHNYPILRYFDLGWVSVILCGTPIFISAFKNLRRGKITSSLLIATSITACVALEILSLTGVLKGGDHGHSNIFAAGEVAWLMALGELIESYTVGKARSGIEAIMKLAPVTAKLVTEDGYEEVAVSELNIGDKVAVLPNDMISVDGIIVKGSTSVDESIMTGESLPVDKTVGDMVYGGTFNKSYAIEVEVTKNSEDFAVSKLKKLVAEAEGKRAPISKIADKWAGYIVPMAITISILVFIISFFALSGRNVAVSVERAITVLVVFCPCSLALATPTAIAAALGTSTKQGVLIKSGEAVEKLSRINAVAFDKTGTLTEGRISVESVKAFGIEEDRLKALLYAAEKYSEHPIAKAITAYFEGVEQLKAESTKSLVGTGVEAVIDGKVIRVEKWNSSLGGEADEALKEGKTVIGVTEDEKLVGLLTLSDTVRDESKFAVKELNDMGVMTVMLTGDNETVAKTVGESLGINKIYGALMPDQKLEKIEELKKNRRKVVMVGDGVNDAPALALADASIAMGAFGADLAVETADVALMNNDIKKVPSLLKLARRTLKKIKLNIAIAMCINFAAVLLSLFGILNPVWGALIHNVSSVLVVTNSALLLKHNM